MARSGWFGAVRRLTATATVLALVLAALTPLTSRAEEWSPPEAVYIAETGHNLYEPFLSFWRDNGRTGSIGDPISESFKEGGITFQYFEKARLELRGDTVVRGAIGSEYLAARGVDLTDLPSRPRLLRGNEFDEPSTTPFTRLRAAVLPNDEDHRFFPESGHTLNSSFKLAWEQGGLARFGYPVSEEFAEVSPIDGKVYTTQYFERARFEYHPETSNNYSVVLTPLGATVAAARGVHTAAVAQGELPTYSEALFTPPPPPAPTASRPAGAPAAAKLIDVDLSEQYLTAFEGNTVVYEGYISSGTGDNPTPVGTFSVFSKLVADDMRGPDPNLPGGQYFQPDVPWVMYFAAGGYAIHGVYWHSSFGTPRSHGCVGTPVGAANFLYNWAPIGTLIYIHY
jgi:lipoprotein-anchoring transpeptidase ErfK/SrfK